MVFVGWTTFYFIFSFNICVRINFLNLFTLMISKNNLLDSRDKNLNWNMLILLSTANWKITFGGGGVDCFFHIQFLATRNIFNFCIIYFIKFQQSITFLLIFTNSGCFIEKCSFLNLFHNNYLWCKIQWYPITRVELPKV